MAKILNINNDADYYYERGIDKSDAAEYIDAIDNFYLALDREGENIWIYSEIAGNYLELDLVDEALALYYKVIALDRKADIGYLGAMQCLVKQNMIPQALFYLNLGIKNGALTSELELDESFFDEDEEPRLKIAGKNDTKDMVSLARKMMLSGDTEFARQMLEGVPATSPQSREARNYLALIALGDNEIDRALALTNDILSEDDTDIPAITTRIVAYNLLGEHERENETVAYLDSLNLTDKTDINKAAVCMQQIQNSRMAVKFYTQALMFDPYDRDILLILSIAHSNCGEHKKARRYMLTLRKLYRDDMTVAYYARLFNKNYHKQLELTVELPDKIRRFRMSYIKNRLAALGTPEAVSRELDENDRLYEAVMWLFQSDEIAMMGQVGAFLARDRYWRPFVEDLLVDPGIHYRVKKECLLSLLRHAPTKKFTLLISDVLQFFRPRLPKLPAKPELVDAYWQLYTTLAFIDSDFDKRINAAYRSLIKAVEAADFSRFELNASTLAAVMANHAGLHRIFDNPTDCCEIFSCDETEMRTYMKVLKLKPRESERVRSRKPKKADE